jgi:hypothetical protein
VSSVPFSPPHPASPCVQSTDGQRPEPKEMTPRLSSTGLSQRPIAAFDLTYRSRHPRDMPSAPPPRPPISTVNRWPDRSLAS